MKIVIDRDIPFINGVLEPFAEVVYCDGAAISSEVVCDADAIVTRTRTQCNRELLERSTIEVICSATIGFDHIDIGYCAQRGIAVRTAAGCNSRAVLQWFAAAVSYLCNLKGWSPKGRTVGVVGVGCVGSLVAEYAAYWGFDVICCDPPRALREVEFESTSLEELLEQCDIITIHTPLNDSTYHLLNSSTLAKTKESAVILNSSRGATVDCEALLCSGREYILDVWEGEPHISRELLDRAILATPHIAGYSLQGKAMATQMSIRSLASIMELPLTEWKAPIEWCESSMISWEDMQRSIVCNFDIASLSATLKERAECFEVMRNEYDYRTEYF